MCSEEQPLSVLSNIEHVNWARGWGDNFVIGVNVRITVLNQKGK